ncbi:hypothetical protein GS3922_09505 [Geobacillus subterraneus]|uniref:Uncharacterized protein n=2 Tax=Geobacillus TaxID=129337 RepID=A0ABM6AC70_9BACL|nr:MULTISPECIES: hypothetical protein [Geobacillus]AMX83878.1 hypothetical protein GS3922_09505 [Geobacillus subterraneus]KZS25899.1 hypothetical protein A5418_03005 [Geobacillus subterraneus]OXB88083.1 hypothetical protein B9L21_09400 [Geobacillus uzenensis]WPZ19695.1 hypothetical protein UM396_07265 [Geobacillus subterraneus]
MIVHELMDMEHLFAEQLQEGYYIIRETYQNVLIEPKGGDAVRQVDAGTEEVVTLLFDPGDEYSLLCLDTYTFTGGIPSLTELKETIAAEYDVFVNRHRAASL